MVCRPAIASGRPAIIKQCHILQTITDRNVVGLYVVRTRLDTTTLK